VEEYEKKKTSNYFEVFYEVLSVELEVFEPSSVIINENISHGLI
jgi:hypothetical protein